MQLTVVDLRNGGVIENRLLSRDGDDRVTCLKVMMAIAIMENTNGGNGTVYSEDVEGGYNGTPAIVCGYHDEEENRVPVVAVLPMTVEQWAGLCPVAPDHKEDVE